MPYQNDVIKSCVVKIEDENGELLQSGVLWMPAEESEVAYVFTVTHGIKENKPSNIRFWNGSVEFVRPVIEGFLHSDEVDAAILVIANDGLPLSPYAFRAPNDLEAMLNKGSTNVQLKVLGYPKSHCSGGYPGPNQQHYFPCAFDNFHLDEKNWTFIAFYSSDARISPIDPEADLEGFSGGGLFAIIQNAAFLCGIYRGTPTATAGSRDIMVLSLPAIQEICSAHNLPFPDFQPLIPDYLNKHLRACLNDLGSGHILLDSLREVARYNFKELILSNCGQCNLCEYREHFYLCDQFQQQLLKSSALLKYHNGNVFDEREYLRVKKDEDYHEVRIICSDVSPARVSRLIQVLKQDYLGKNELSENMLILWASKEQYKPLYASCTRTEYQNIICNISMAPQNYLDFSDVNEAPEQLAIISVPYILNEMEANPNAFSDFVSRM